MKSHTCPLRHKGMIGCPDGRAGLVLYRPSSSDIMSTSQSCPLLGCVPWPTSPGRAAGILRHRRHSSPIQERVSTEETSNPLNKSNTQSTTKSSFRRRVESFPRSLSRLDSLNTDTMVIVRPLKKLLAERKVEMTYGNEKRPQTWLPYDAIEELLASEEGQRSLRTVSADTDKLQSFVSRSKRLWALLVHVNRLRWLNFFCNEGFDDRYFPVQRRGEWEFKSCSSKNIVVMPGEPGDDETAFESIEEQQWQFFVPTFGPKSFTCGFESNCRLPFIKEFRTEETNFSAVTEFVMHRKHLNCHFNDQIVRDTSTAFSSGN